MSRNNGYELHMIRNVRPAVELPGPSRWPALTALGVLIVSVALLTFVLGS